MKKVLVTLFFSVIFGSIGRSYPAMDATKISEKLPLISVGESPLPSEFEENLLEPAIQNPLTLTISDATVACGEEVCLQVATQDFVDIAAMQFSINFDPSQLEFTAVRNINLTGMSVNSFGVLSDRITLVWFDFDFSGETLPDGTVIFELCFNTIGSGSTVVEFSNDPPGIEITGPQEQQIGFTGLPGTVTCDDGGCPECTPGKVEICLVPPGNPSNAKTKCIEEADAINHLNNGSYCGPCTGPNISAPSPPGQAGSSTLEGLAGLTVYPNPVSDQLNIAFQEPPVSPQRIRLLDLSGRILREQVTGAGVFQHQIDVSDLMSGLYLLQVRGATESRNVKVVVE